MAADKICSMCKKGGLHWESTVAGWRLHTAEGYMHQCPAYESREKSEPSRAQQLRANEERLARIAEQISQNMNHEDHYE